MEIGNQIRKYRKGLNLSQSELAEKIYVSSQTISNWENERSYPDVHNLINLSILFEVSLDELVKGDVMEMKNVLERKQMDVSSKYMLLFTILACISVGPALMFESNWALLVPAILWAISFYYALKVEGIKKQYNVKTFKEIVDFMEHGKISENPQRNKIKYYTETSFIVLIFSLLAALIAIGSIYFFEMIM